MLSGGESISVVHAPPVLRSAVPPPADDGRRTTDDRRPRTAGQRPPNTHPPPAPSLSAFRCRPLPAPAHHQRDLNGSPRHVTVRLRGSTRRADELVRVVRNDEATRALEGPNTQTTGRSVRPVRSKPSSYFILFIVVILSYRIHLPVRVVVQTAEFKGGIRRLGIRSQAVERASRST